MPINNCRPIWQRYTKSEQQKHNNNIYTFSNSISSLEIGRSSLTKSFNPYATPKYNAGSTVISPLRYFLDNEDAITIGTTTIQSPLTSMNMIHSKGVQSIDTMRMLMPTTILNGSESSQFNLNFIFPNEDVINTELRPLLAQTMVAPVLPIRSIALTSWAIPLTNSNMIHYQNSANDLKKILKGETPTTADYKKLYARTAPRYSIDRVTLSPVSGQTNAVSASFDITLVDSTTNSLSGVPRYLKTDNAAIAQLLWTRNTHMNSSIDTTESLFSEAILSGFTNTNHEPYKIASGFNYANNNKIPKINAGSYHSLCWDSNKKEFIQIYYNIGIYDYPQKTNELENFETAFVMTEEKDNDSVSTYHTQQIGNLPDIKNNSPEIFGLTQNGGNSIVGIYIDKMNDIDESNDMKDIEEQVFLGLINWEKYSPVSNIMRDQLVTNVVGKIGFETPFNTDAYLSPAYKPSFLSLYTSSSLPNKSKDKSLSSSTFHNTIKNESKKIKNGDITKWVTTERTTGTIKDVSNKIADSLKQDDTLYSDIDVFKKYLQSYITVVHTLPVKTNVTNPGEGLSSVLAWDTISFAYDNNNQKIIALSADYKSASPYDINNTSSFFDVFGHYFQDEGIVGRITANLTRKVNRFNANFTPLGSYNDKKLFNDQIYHLLVNKVESSLTPIQNIPTPVAVVSALRNKTNEQQQNTLARIYHFDNFVNLKKAYKDKIAKYKPADVRIFLARWLIATTHYSVIPTRKEYIKNQQFNISLSSILGPLAFSDRLHTKRHHINSNGSRTTIVNHILDDMSYWQQTLASIISGNHTQLKSTNKWFDKYTSDVALKDSMLTTVHTPYLQSNDSDYLINPVTKEDITTYLEYSVPFTKYYRSIMAEYDQPERYVAGWNSKSKKEKSEANLKSYKKGDHYPTILDIYDYTNTGISFVFKMPNNDTITRLKCDQYNSLTLDEINKAYAYVLSLPVKIPSVPVFLRTYVTTVLKYSIDSIITYYHEGAKSKPSFSGQLSIQSKFFFNNIWIDKAVTITSSAGVKITLNNFTACLNHINKKFKSKNADLQSPISNQLLTAGKDKLMTLLGGSFRTTLLKLIMSSHELYKVGTVTPKVTPYGIIEEFIKLSFIISNSTFDPNVDIENYNNTSIKKMRDILTLPSVIQIFDTYMPQSNLTTLATAIHEVLWEENPKTKAWEARNILNEMVDSIQNVVNNKWYRVTKNSIGNKVRKLKTYDKANNTLNQSSKNVLEKIVHTDQEDSHKILYKYLHNHKSSVSKAISQGIQESVKLTSAEDINTHITNVFIDGTINSHHGNKAAFLSSTLCSTGFCGTSTTVFSTPETQKLIDVGTMKPLVDYMNQSIKYLNQCKQLFNTDPYNWTELKIPDSDIIYDITTKGRTLSTDDASMTNTIVTQYSISRDLANTHIHRESNPQPVVQNFGGGQVSMTLSMRTNDIVFMNQLMIAFSSDASEFRTNVKKQNMSELFGPDAMVKDQKKLMKVYRKNLNALMGLTPSSQSTFDIPIFIQNNLANMNGIYSCNIAGLQLQTVDGQPNTYDININLLGTSTSLKNFETPRYEKPTLPKEPARNLLSFIGISHTSTETMPLPVKLNEMSMKLLYMGLVTLEVVNVIAKALYVNSSTKILKASSSTSYYNTSMPTPPPSGVRQSPATNNTNQGGIVMKTSATTKPSEEGLGVDQIAKLDIDNIILEAILNVNHMVSAIYMMPSKTQQIKAFDSFIKDVRNSMFVFTGIMDTDALTPQNVVKEMINNIVVRSEDDIVAIALNASSIEKQKADITKDYTYDTDVVKKLLTADLKKHQALGTAPSDLEARYNRLGEIINYYATGKLDEHIDKYGLLGLITSRYIIRDKYTGLPTLDNDRAVLSNYESKLTSGLLSFLGGTGNSTKQQSGKKKTAYHTAKNNLKNGSSKENRFGAAMGNQSSQQAMEGFKQYVLAIFGSMDNKDTNVLDEIGLNPNDASNPPVLFQLIPQLDKLKYHITENLLDNLFIHISYTYNPISTIKIKSNYATHQNTNKKSTVNARSIIYKATRDLFDTKTGDLSKQLINGFVYDASGTEAPYAYASTSTSDKIINSLQFKYLMKVTSAAYILDSNTEIGYIDKLDNEHTTYMRDGLVPALHLDENMHVMMPCSLVFTPELMRRIVTFKQYYDNVDNPTFLFHYNRDFSKVNKQNNHATKTDGIIYRIKYSTGACLNKSVYDVTMDDVIKVKNACYDILAYQISKSRGMSWQNEHFGLLIYNDKNAITIKLENDYTAAMALTASPAKTLQLTTIRKTINYFIRSGFIFTSSGNRLNTRRWITEDAVMMGIHARIQSDYTRSPSNNCSANQHLGMYGYMLPGVKQWILIDSRDELKIKIKAMHSKIKSFSKDNSSSCIANKILMSQIRYDTSLLDASIEGYDGSVWTVLAPIILVLVVIVVVCAAFCFLPIVAQQFLMMAARVALRYIGRGVIMVELMSAVKKIKEGTFDGGDALMLALTISPLGALSRISKIGRASKGYIGAVKYSKKIASIKRLTNVRKVQGMSQISNKLSATKTLIKEMAVAGGRNRGIISKSNIFSKALTGSTAGRTLALQAAAGAGITSVASTGVLLGTKMFPNAAHQLGVTAPLGFAKDIVSLIFGTGRNSFRVTSNPFTYAMMLQENAVNIFIEQDIIPSLTNAAIMIPKDILEYLIIEMSDIKDSLARYYENITAYPDLPLPAFSKGEYAINPYFLKFISQLRKEHPHINGGLFNNLFATQINSFISPSFYIYRESADNKNEVLRKIDAATRINSLAQEHTPNRELMHIELIKNLRITAQADVHSFIGRCNLFANELQSSLKATPKRNKVIRDIMQAINPNLIQQETAKVDLTSSVQDVMKTNTFKVGQTLTSALITLRTLSKNNELLSTLLNLISQAGVITKTIEELRILNMMTETGATTKQNSKIYNALLKPWEGIISDNAGTTMALAMRESANNSLKRGMIGSADKEYPTYKVYFIEEDNKALLLFNDFFSYGAIQSIDVFEAEQQASATCVITLSNSYGNLQSHQTGVQDNVIKTSVFDESNSAISTIMLKPGCMIQVKMGYKAILLEDEITFTGVITEIAGDSVLTLTCQSHGAQLTKQIGGGSGKKIGGSIKSVILDQHVSKIDNLIWAIFDEADDISHLGCKTIFADNNVTVSDYKDIRDNWQGIKDNSVYMPLIKMAAGDVGSELISGFVDTKFRNVLTTEINNSGGDQMFKKWLIYRESIWDNLTSLKHQGMQLVSMVRPFDDEGTYIFAEEHDYYQFTDSLSGSNSRIRSAINKIRTILKSGNSLKHYVASEYNKMIITGKPTPFMAFYLMNLFIRAKKYDVGSQTSSQSKDVFGILKDTQKGSVSINTVVKLYHDMTKNTIPTKIGNKTEIKQTDKYNQYEFILSHILSLINMDNVASSKRVKLDEYLKSTASTDPTYAAMANAIYDKELKEGKLNPDTASAMIYVSNIYMTQSIEVASNALNAILMQLVRISPQHRAIRESHHKTSQSDIVKNDIRLNDGYNSIKLSYLHSGFYNSVADFYSGNAFGMSSMTIDNINKPSAHDEVTVNLSPHIKSYNKKTFSAFDKNAGGMTSLARWAHVTVATNMLKEKMEDYYSGSLTLIGDPYIKAGDTIYMEDSYRDMWGMIKVKEVHHMISKESGFITTVTPGLMTDLRRDPGAIDDTTAATHGIAMGLGFALKIAFSIKMLKAGGRSLIRNGVGTTLGKATKTDVTGSIDEKLKGFLKMSNYKKLFTGKGIFNKTMGALQTPALNYFKYGAVAKLGNVLGNGRTLLIQKYEEHYNVQPITTMPLIFRGQAYMANVEGVKKTDTTMYSPGTVFSAAADGLFSSARDFIDSIGDVKKEIIGKINTAKSELKDQVKSFETSIKKQGN